MALNKNIKLFLNYVIGPALLIVLFYTVSRQLQHQHGWKNSLQQIWEALIGKQNWKLYGMFGLMWVNWGLEAAKWQISIFPIQHMRFPQAFKAVMAGACIASFTPNRVGEYLGRMLYVDPGKKVRSVAPAIICSMAQMLITLLAGSVGLFFFSRFIPEFRGTHPDASYFKIFLLITILSALLLGTLYFRFEPLVGRVNGLLKKYNRAFYIPESFSARMLFKILFISLIRYGVFLLQYFLLFSLFGVDLAGIQVFVGVSVMFVVMAIIPSLTLLTDLGLRWEAGIQIFQVFTVNTAGILAVSLGIWLVNLIIPALIGSLLILRIKLFSSR
ncbi:MAG: lysylphosphatidylglycerol synthase domain-containing protein [Bacteroidota bacterium]|nr:lysylphosphatidylglycerol synthase domain-containing protein [Bacteroidota bacterium]